MANAGNDTYRASAIVMILVGLIFLVDNIVPFSSMGLPWVTKIDNLIGYASVVFLAVKKDKAIGLVLGGIWVLFNFSYIVSLLGHAGKFIIPAMLIIAGILVLKKNWK